MWEKVRFNEIYIGDDWKGNARWEETGKEMESLGAKLVFLPYTKDTSSTYTSREVRKSISKGSSDHGKKPIKDKTEKDKINTIKKNTRI